MTRICLVVLAAALLSGMFLGCNMSPSEKQQEPKVEAYTPAFSYTPPAQAEPDSAGVTLLLGSADVKVKALPGITWLLSKDIETWFPHQQFKSLGDELEPGFLSLLTAKGFSVRGPFASYDKIPFPDKKGSDLILISTTELSLDAQDYESKSVKIESKLGGGKGSDMTGKFVLSGKINLELREPLTRELMWSKSLEIPNTEVPYNVILRDEDSIKGNVAPYYAVLLNYVAKAIEKEYPAILGTAWESFDPEEMRLVKKQAQELKEKK
ncbi:MAG: hypothetical protein HY811_00795 [Planctomycetes bacterium]|nr:hypothetical protein [Planctomycetota bacterium]